MKPFVIPIFIAHQGCPHRCIFCDQHTITGATGVADEPVTPATLRQTIEQWLRRPRRERQHGVQVAFYGGSFTGLSRSRQQELLATVKPYIETGEVDCIRISTRPDYIDERSVALLREYSVAIVELGIQSLEPAVLDASRRGHSVQQSEAAIRLLRQQGFIVGAQIMCGLPGDSTSGLMATTARLAALAPDFIRIYPVLVIKGSGLEKLYRQGHYKPLSLARAVALSCRMHRIFSAADIKVVRMGLQPSEQLAEKVVAGPYHPAFGELVMARTLFAKTRKLLRQEGSMQGKRLSIAAADESVFRGPGNVSLKRLSVLGLLDGANIIFAKEQPRNSVVVC